MKTTERKHPTNEKILIKVETDKYGDHYLLVMTNGFQLPGIMIKPEIVPLIVDALLEHFDIASLEKSLHQITKADDLETAVNIAYNALDNKTK